MSEKERLHEVMSAPPTLELLAQRFAEGWKMVAVDWERQTESAAAVSKEPIAEPIPFGLRVSDDGTGLVENPVERQIVIAALDMIVDDRPLSQVADELNRRGFRTRDLQFWTPTALFVLLPRMIEIGPRLFSSADWADRKQRLRRVV